jgi:hypothetical protein
VSSILDALRELEGTKPSAQRSRAAWAAGEAEERPPLRRAAEVLGIVAFGLALGAVAFGLFVWLGVGDEQRPDASASKTAATTRARQAVPAPPSQALAPAAPAPPVPGWLARMGPPRGRIDEGDATRGAAAAEPVVPRAAGLSLVSVHYAESRSQRSATLRIDGSPVILHEGDTAHGIELQLVTPAGAYVRRGAEVLMLEPAR